MRDAGYMDMLADTDDWEDDDDYFEEAIQAEADRQNRERFERLPELCKHCRWMEWYYTEECQYHHWPYEGRCSLHLRRIPYFRPRPIWLWLVTMQWWIWRLITLQARKDMGIREPSLLSGYLSRHEELVLWLHKLHLQWQVRRWLRGTGPDSVAAYCMFHLNHFARSHGNGRSAIYGLKNRLLRVFYEMGMCRVASLQIQKMECWECNGTGEEWHDHEPCWKCNGTGVYRQHVLWQFVFDVQGRRYVWHQPKSLVDWSVTGSLDGLKEYHGHMERYVDAYLDNDLRELYLMAVREYLRMRGAPGRYLVKLPTMRTVIEAEWRRSWLCRWLKKWHRVRDGLCRLWEMAQTDGAWPAADSWMSEAEDEIPF